MSGEKNRFEFILQHGWGLSSSCYSEWKNILEGMGHIVKIPDRGYFGSPLKIEGFETQYKKVLVSHSFGLYLFDKNLFKQADYLIIISGFKGFHPDDKKEKRRSSILMRLMKKKILVEPEKLLVDFYNGYDLRGEKDLIPDSALLHEDLMVIDEEEPDIENMVKIDNILILHGKKDMVVSLSRAVDLNKALKGSHMIVFDDGDHALPFSKSSELIEIIIDYMEKQEVFSVKPGHGFH